MKKNQIDDFNFSKIRVKYESHGLNIYVDQRLAVTSSFAGLLMHSEKVFNLLSPFLKNDFIEV